MTQFCQLSSSFPPPLLSSFSILRNGLYFIVKKIKFTIIQTFFEIPAENNYSRWYCYRKINEFLLISSNCNNVFAYSQRSLMI